MNYYVARKLILLGLGWMYLLAFWGAYKQNEGLMGENGLQPVTSHIEDTIKKRKYNCQQPFSFSFSFSSATLELFNNSSHLYSYFSDDENNNLRNCVKGFKEHPSLFWFYEYNDTNMKNLHLIGITLSLLLIVGSMSPTTTTTITTTMISGCGCSMVVLLGLWITYFTIVTSANGTPFYQYGWESQLLETGFLATFLCDSFWPTITHTNTNTNTNTYSIISPIVLWLFRWLSYRISIGAGLIKLRGDSCWTDKTCLLYHFETQPIPSPISFIFHFLPPYVLHRAIDLDLFVQVYSSWLVVLPTLATSTFLLYLVRLGGFIQIGFMINIAVSGNLSMLNHLTILPSIACLDDRCFPQCIQNYCRHHDDKPIANNNNLNKQDENNNNNNDNPSYKYYCYWRLNNKRMYIDILLLITILVLSRPVVENLLQVGNTRQSMNASFDSFRLVNTYGAFGSVGKNRYEPIVSIGYVIQNTDNDKEEAGSSSSSTAIDWIELDFPCKPGNVSRRPCFCAPYHYRLDWNIWFIGFIPHQQYLNQRESWLYNLLGKLLEKDDVDDKEKQNNFAAYHYNRPWLDLLDTTSRDMLLKRGPGMYAKVDIYHYKMANSLWKIMLQYYHNSINTNKNHDGGNNNKSIWWNRYYKENLIPIVSYHQQQKQLFRASI